MHTISTQWLWLWLGVAVLISGFFSGSETGMMTVNRYRLQHKARKGEVSAERIMRLLERPDRLLGIILIGNTLANLLASAIATMIAVRLLGEEGVLQATLLLTVLVLIFAEVAPKTLAALYPDRVSHWVNTPLWLLLKIFYPCVWMINTLANWLLRLLGFDVNVVHKHLLSREELHAVLATDSAKIPDTHQTMMLGVLDLDAVTVNAVMVPRKAIQGIDIAQSWSAITRQISQSPFLRWPVYQGTIDNTLGILHIRDALAMQMQGRFTKRRLLSVLEDVPYIPEGARLSDQLLNFQTHKYRMGLLVDEYGEVLGLVTLSDIIEEIVGEFTTDPGLQQRDMRRQADGSYLIAGSVAVRDLNRALGWSLEVTSANTLSGLIIERLQTIPEAGICARISGYPIEVVRVADNQVVLARVYPQLK